MARQLDKRLREILEKYHDDPRSALWDCHGTWVIYHKDVELMAAKAGIEFDAPQILEANGPAKCVALAVTASFEGRRDWSIGEAAPGNNKNAYPYAMAEKRARDRVALKLLGLAGFIYSEEESDDFKQQHKPKEQVDPVEHMQAADLMIRSIEDFCDTAADCDEWQESNRDAVNALIPPEKKRVVAYWMQLRAKLETKEAA